MSKIGVFYGSTTGTTEDVARKIAEKLNVPQGDIHDASTLTDALVKEYDVLVLGTSTWEKTCSQRPIQNEEWRFHLCFFSENRWNV